MQKSIKKSYVYSSDWLLIGSRVLFIDEKIKYPPFFSSISNCNKILIKSQQDFSQDLTVI